MTKIQTVTADSSQTELRQAELSSGQNYDQPLHYQIAVHQIGTTEQAGASTHNPQILKYHSSTTLKASDDETPWCSAFVNWCLCAAGESGTNSAASRSWMQWGAHIDWSNPQNLMQGDVIVLRRGLLPWQGHVGFFAGLDGQGRFEILGGNHDDSVSVRSFDPERVIAARRLAWLIP